MKTFFQKNHRVLFYSSWIILGLVQSGFTELWNDEAYYWVYSKFLDWGYFDHPPMTALLIKIGYSIFQNELGVRLCFVLLNALTLLIIEKLIEKKEPFLFYIIVLSLTVLQLSGFLAVPDIPLVFFTTLFFICYKRFLQQGSLLNIFLLGLVTAALLFSKYHGVLVVFFVLLSNLKLFARYQTYVAGFVALLFFAPHLWWQYQHDWISFRYHLFESNVNPYSLSFTLEYLGGQILFAGPFAGIILLPAAFLYHSKNPFEKGLKFALAGIYIFFLLSSFRGRVEANWTSSTLVPLIILSHNFLAEKNTRLTVAGQTWLRRLLPITMLLVLFARIILIVDILPIKDIKYQYHGWKEWPQMMKEKTKGLPVVFEDSYQRASKYWFYTGQITYSLNSFRSRKNNYDFWPIEDSVIGKPVYIMDINNLDSFQNKITTGIGTLGYKYDSAFCSFTKIRFVPSKKRIEADDKMQLIEINVRPELPQLYYNYIADHPSLKTAIVVGVFDKYHKWVKNLPIPFSLYEMIQKQRSLHFQPNLPEGTYYLIFSIFHTGTINATANSSKIALIVR